MRKPWTLTKAYQVPAREAVSAWPNACEMESELDRPDAELRIDARLAAHAVLTGQAQRFTVDEKRRLLLLLAWQVQRLIPLAETEPPPAPAPPVTQLPGIQPYPTSTDFHKTHVLGKPPTK